MAVPTSVVAQVPRLTLDAPPQLIVPLAQRTSYIAGLPEPSSTCVNVRVTEVSVAPVTARFVTVRSGERRVGKECRFWMLSDTDVQLVRVRRISTSWKS